jgi:hypothetical protein
MTELPPVASGLAMAGLFAVSQGSMDSAVNALASSAVADIYLPLRTMRGRPLDPDKPVDAPKIAVAAMGAVMTGFAVACAYAYDPKQKGSSSSPWGAQLRLQRHARGLSHRPAHPAGEFAVGRPRPG